MAQVRAYLRKRLRLDKADISNNSELGEGVGGSGSDSDPSGDNMDQAKVAMHLGVSVRASGQDLVRRIRDH